MNVEFAVFARVAVRCEEIAGEPGAPQVLANVYQASTGQPLARFLDAMAAVEAATTRARDATAGMALLLGEMDQLFRVGRSTMAAVLPETTLPRTLKAQRTDTDKREAIRQLVETIAANAGQAWADTLLQGELGAKAAVTMQRLDQAIHAQNALQAARTERSRSFRPAWEAYMSFKRLVRDTLGAKSRQYHRIHLRGGAAGKRKVEEGEARQAP